MSESVRAALACLGHASGGSILSNLFGYSLVPKEMSIRDQVKAIASEHYDVNVIRVAPEDMFAGNIHQICYSLQVTREIYGTVGFGIGKVRWYHITAEQAGSHAVIDSSAEASDLTEDWTVHNNALDLFVVRTINGADGWSAVQGSCDKDKKDSLTGSVVELYDGDNDYAANGFAHEMGHYLNLDHIADVGNFIGGDGASDSWTGIYAWQGTDMKKHCFVKPGCG